jgi:bile acid:Na+ symporter, BASS family
VGGLFPQAMLSLVSPGRASYAHGVFFASTVLSVIVTPLSVELFNVIFGGDVRVRPITIAEVTVGAMLLPLGVGLLVGRRWPAVKRWRKPAQKLSSWLLIACLLGLVPAAWSGLLTIVREGTLSALLVLALLSLSIGHLLGGPDDDSRTMLAFSTVSRHPGVALAVASLTQQPHARIGVLLAVIMNQLAVIPYKRWRKRIHAGGTPAEAQPRA